MSTQIYAGQIKTDTLSGTLDINISGSAVKDSNNQNIADTYIKGLSFDNNTLTYTKGDGDTGTVGITTGNTYAAGTGISITDNTINHADTITASTLGSSANTSGATFNIPYATYNNTGHITAAGNRSHTITLSDLDGAASSHTHNYAGSSSAGGAATSALTVNTTVSAGNTGNLLYATMGSNDYFRLTVGGSTNAGYAEIATADDGSEPIYVRQYSGTFTTLTRTATLLDGDGNTSFPGNLTANSVTGTWLDVVQNLNTLSSATTINFSNGSYVKFTVGGSFVLSFTAGGTCRMAALEFTYNDSDYDITWNGVEWSGGSAPEFDTEGGVNIVTLVTSDGGTTWYGMLSGKAFA